MPRLSARARLNAEWIEKYLRVPDGKFVGHPVKLSPEQLAWAGSYDCEVLACEVSMLADAEPDAEPVWQDVEPEPGE
jgi:hypothetical protein